MNSVFILWTRVVNEPSQSFPVLGKGPTRKNSFAIGTLVFTVKLHECSLIALLWTHSTGLGHTTATTQDPTQAAELRCLPTNVKLDENRSGSC